MTDPRNNPRDESLINQAAKDSRAQEARMLPNKGELTKEQIESVKKAVNQRCDEQGLTYERVDSQIGASRRATRRFMNGDYEHDDARFARRLNRWLIIGDESEDGLPTSYVSTEVAEKMLALLKSVKNRKSMGIIIAPSGTSKSTVLKAAERGHIPGSFRLELRSTDYTPVKFLRRFSTEIGGPRKTDTQSHIQWIIDFFSGSKRLIMIDEAHFLNKQSINVVRDIHKATGCPIVLVGTRDLTKTINDYDPFHGQIKSTISMTYNVTVEANKSGRPLFSVDEIIEFAQAMNIRLDTSAADEVTRLANSLGWGGLRSAGYLMLNARLLTGGKTLTLKSINTALREMEGSDGFDRTKNKMAEPERKVAAA